MITYEGDEKTLQNILDAMDGFEKFEDRKHAAELYTKCVVKGEVNNEKLRSKMRRLCIGPKI